MLESKPGLVTYLGRKVIVGIRPSDFEDASLGDVADCPGREEYGNGYAAEPWDGCPGTHPAAAHRFIRAGPFPATPSRYCCGVPRRLQTWLLAPRFNELTSG